MSGWGALATNQSRISWGLEARARRVRSERAQGPWAGPGPGPGQTVCGVPCSGNRSNHTLFALLLVLLRDEP